MESGHGIGPDSDMRADPATTLSTDKDDQITPGKKLSSSSSSSSSLHEDPLIGLDTNETNKSTVDATTESPPGHGKDSSTQSASLCSEEDIPVSSMPRHEQHSDGAAAAAESPATQEMKRPDNDSTPSSSSYRIPSSVFARTISTAPVEWSTASNESLFSIHMGNMSFTRDHYMYKSGELGLFNEYNNNIPRSSVDYSSNQPPTNKSTELVPKYGSNLGGGFDVTEAAAAEMMREVIRENEEGRRRENSAPMKEPSCSATPSDNSVEGARAKSFAFPILTGNGDKTGSSNQNKEKGKQHSQSQPETPTVTPKSEPQQTPETTSWIPKVNWGKCLSCFSCCSFCS
ncbi:hypothetical protein CFOL_v3_07918 [Cephalotus follicularis]|uniref:Uncharacterized protein n=1 Tax=Cephalotus follicularis TaxID=3775 RepID=A0A1Q3B8V2_CEPFO|nr:hypothetical protein CFOL_v3_07918 [Cephalotus follicularis]